MGRERSRRAVLYGMALTSSSLAGCSSDDEATETDIEDSDGDGVVDSQDYAPRDPDVQSKADVQTAVTTAETITTPPDTETPTERPTPTEAPTPTPTETPTPTPEPTPEPGPQDSVNTLSVERHLTNQSHIRSYSATDVAVRVSSYPEIPQRRVKVFVASYQYPRGDAVAWGESLPFDAPTGDETVDISVTISNGDIPRGTRLHHMVFTMPADETIESVSTQDLSYLYESDPYTVEPSSDEIRRSPPEHAQPDDSADSFERQNVEGAYRLVFDGQTQGRSWGISLYIWKSSYSEAINEPRGRSYSEYVAVAQNGNASTIAEILDTAAENNGFTEKREKIELVIDWVQSFPYVTDNVSRGYDDYPKLLPETLVDVSGDCEDTSILLAATLQAEPFGYDMVLIQPPEHMAVGIYGSDLPGYYWQQDGRKYFYIETTGEGWGIGDLPETYQNADAIVHQV